MLVEAADAAGVVSAAKLDDKMDAGAGRRGGKDCIGELLPPMRKPKHVLPYPLLGDFGIGGKELEVDLGDP